MKRIVSNQKSQRPSIGKGIASDDHNGAIWVLECQTTPTPGALRAETDSAWSDKT
eukprot:CAMPEP_0185748902 /NCGR_PEP_ID=MMETSP1174-20130828/7627_1 /TAXON_ID=35687 /ORGANISM="Dictyocha speculum, Strain CCMP1381" /LENGTH=54 /DNA_ID=CAMNT_0028424795 /DNA_START=191 /DNA_END=355 /DNA_ORIENTATION=-